MFSPASVADIFSAVEPGDFDFSRAGNKAQDASNVVRVARSLVGEVNIVVYAVKLTIHFDVVLGRHFLSLSSRLKGFCQRWRGYDFQEKSSIIFFMICHPQPVR